MTVVLRESGKIGWISDKKPKKLLINDMDDTSKLEQRDKEYVIELPETSCKVACTLIW